MASAFHVQHIDEHIETSTTTTSTFTPTTMNNVDENYVRNSLFNPPMQHSHQAGFIPPVIINQHTNNMINNMKQNFIVNDLTRSKRRHYIDEEERKRIRRERNKLAAARCRQKRVDLTNYLAKETAALEERKKQLEHKLKHLQNFQHELQSLVNKHAFINS